MQKVAHDMQKIAYSM